MAYSMMVAAAHRRAFNLGCDARIAGRSQLTCPYFCLTWERRLWLAGWDDVDKFWGHEAKRWQVEPLPVVNSRN